MNILEDPTKQQKFKRILYISHITAQYRLEACDS